MARKQKQQEVKPFTFVFEDKTYRIAEPYDGKPTTLVLSDGKIVEVRMWRLVYPMEPKPEKIETFDPQQQDAAQLAQEKNGFFAELVTTA